MLPSNTIRDEKSVLFFYEAAQGTHPEARKKRIPILKIAFLDQG
ncbi:hypothetical protein SAMN05421852_12811 [Thermoflavimicrobium dichotomicum]|uniref:Uncharacterized protein n=1 Tax=Thermoflavimicrobium dichotomicum TaxID=46223 RepID=A0A1I3UX41_9BACL|nr:hypothetical protein SAMN05421852_12811 [Thermoflavimicrobium dichotomicum]